MRIDPFSSLATNNPTEQVLNAFVAARTPIYIVGGAVRDHVLGISTLPVTNDYSSQATGVLTTDLDLILAGPVLPLARRVADQLGWAFYPLDMERDMARLICTGADGQRLVCDVAALRGTLHADLLARDFTANALALEISLDGPAQLIDVCGGSADIEARRLCRITADSLKSDPARLLRAVRLGAQLGFTIEQETRAQIKANAATILDTSVERVRDELWKLLDTACPRAGIEELRALGLLAPLLPEVEAMQGIDQSPPHHLDVYHHSLLVMDYAAELRDWLRGGPGPADVSLAQVLRLWTDPLRAHFTDQIASGHDRAGWLVWHGLFHDTGKPGSRSLGRKDGVQRVRFFGHEGLSATLAGQRVAALHFSRREVLLAQRVAKAHMRPRDARSKRATFRFFRDTGNDATGHLTGLDVILQAIADRQATGFERGAPWHGFLQVMENLLAYVFTRPAGHQMPLVDGHTLMNHLGLAPGPTVGRLLRTLAEAQAVGELSTTQEALALAEKLMTCSSQTTGHDSSL